MITELPQDQPSAFGTEYWTSEVIGTINLVQIKIKLKEIDNYCRILIPLDFKNFRPTSGNLILDFIESVIKFQDNLPLEFMVNNKILITHDHKRVLAILRNLNESLYVWVNEVRKVKDLLGNPFYKEIYQKPVVIKQIITNIYIELFTRIGIITLPHKSLEEILEENYEELKIRYSDLYANFRYGKDSNLALQYLIKVHILLNNTQNIPIKLEENSNNKILISPVLTMGSLFGYIFQQILLNEELANSPSGNKDEIFLKYSNSFFISSTYTVNNITSGHITPGLIEWVIRTHESKEEFVVYIVEDFIYSGYSPGAVAKCMALELAMNGLDPNKILKNVKMISAEDGMIFEYRDVQNPSKRLLYDYSRNYVWENQEGNRTIVIPKN